MGLIEAGKDDEDGDTTPQVNGVGLVPAYSINSEGQDRASSSRTVGVPGFLRLGPILRYHTLLQRSLLSMSFH